MNKANQINNPGLNFNNTNINQTQISNKERINSPETNGYSSNTYIGSNSNTVLKNETQDEIRKNYNSNSLLTANSSKNNSNKKNIHTLHNLHKNTLNLKINKPENEKKISSEFRKILKLKLTKNSDKIFANLKKLTNFNETSRINNESRRETLKSESPYEKPQEMNRIMSNPDLLKRDRDIKIIDCELEEYNSPNNIINMNFNSTQNSKQPSKKPNYNIMTNLTESKYLGNY
jgi:hypothetical protein